jgi:mannose-1-phosphate guanylyltransferase
MFVENPSERSLTEEHHRSMEDMPEAIVLCGGSGLRLRSVTDTPKAMATVGGRPFLEILLRQLGRNEIKRAVLAVGYKSDVIQSHFGEQAFGVRIQYSHELVPLGTGGALRNAASLVESNIAIVMNGDTYTDIDLQRFVIHHQRSNADGSVVVVPVDGRGDYGAPRLDECNRLLAFDEKPNDRGSQYMNAGIYILSRELLFDIESGSPISIEREMFPQWLAEGRYMQAFVHNASCVDIGTPERYLRAQSILRQAELD